MSNYLSCYGTFQEIILETKKRRVMIRRFSNMWFLNAKKYAAMLVIQSMNHGCSPRDRQWPWHSFHLKKNQNAMMKSSEKIRLGIFFMFNSFLKPFYHLLIIFGLVLDLSSEQLVWMSRISCKMSHYYNNIVQLQKHAR